MILTQEVLSRWLHRGACALTGVFVVAVPGLQFIDPVAYPPQPSAMVPEVAAWAAQVVGTQPLQAWEVPAPQGNPTTATA